MRDTLKLFNLSNKSIFVICEISGNHNNSFKHVKHFLNEIVKQKVDLVKFQVYKPETLTINSNKKDFKLKNIKTTTLNQILKNNNFFKIDFLNVDIEGHELEVLKSFDFKKFEVNIICIELLNFNEVSKIRKKQIELILKKNRFKLVDKSEINYIFKRIK